ncbi:MAG: glycosyltransferase family protein [Bacteroidetes Order II. Incertae sedis bacterium]|nr:glycosyltransferase family protein [Bacteroidetes Order II. bacterium]
MVGAIIQARMGSSRLPAKVLKTLPYDSHITVLDRIIQVLESIPEINKVIIAIPNTPQDDSLAQILADKKVLYYRGSEQDVLSRFYEASHRHKLQTILRFTADNPCIDATFIHQTLVTHLAAGADYTNSQGLPLGTNLEVFSFTALEKAFKAADTPYEREHVTPYIKNIQNGFMLHTIAYKGFDPELRLTLDTAQDYTFQCCLFLALKEANLPLTLPAIQEVIHRHPWMTEINRHIKQAS